VVDAWRIQRVEDPGRLDFVAGVPANRLRSRVLQDRGREEYRLEREAGGVEIEQIGEGNGRAADHGTFMSIAFCGRLPLLIGTTLPGRPARAASLMMPA
jgi:hypothetical protein